MSKEIHNLQGLLNNVKPMINTVTNELTVEILGYTQKTSLCKFIFCWVML